MNKNYSARINYPIEWVFNRDSVIVMEPLPKGVMIDVTSGGWNLVRKTLLLFNTPISIELDNPSEISFYTRSSLLPIVKEKLDGLNVNFLITDTLFINIEKKVIKNLALVVDSVSLSMGEGYRLTSPIKIDPDTVVFSGPQLYLDTLDDHYFIYPKESGIDEDFNESVEVYVPDGYFIQSEPSEVRVKFNVEKFDRLKIAVPIEQVNFPQDSSVVLDRETVDVVFTIRNSARQEYKVEDFAITADYTMFDENDSTVLAMLMYYPEQLIELEVVPENIKIRANRLE
ncbi:MAG: hypothetical protein RIA69_20625 [Cyclobacteriaceae bacterium]